MYSRWLICCFIACALSTSSAQGQESDSWWPLGSSEKTESRPSSYFDSKPKSSATSSTSSSWFKWPSKSKSKTKSGSVVTRATKTSKKWWDNTVDFVNPFNDSKPAPEQRYQSPSWADRNKKPEEESPGWFSWMWKEEKVEEAPTSINDWMKQGRPEY